ncbi:MAG: hypothetical protein AB7S75_23760 [Desulfococcaceae bacterium]
MKPIFLSETQIYRISNDLLRGELRRIRGAKSELPDFEQDAVFTDAPWNMDSIEIMEMTAAVNEFFHLYKTGLEDNLLRYKNLSRWIEMISLSWQEHSEEITFRTSGSTGEPGQCTHSMDVLMQEAEELSRIFAGRKRMISFVPAHHIYGFIFTVLLPVQMGIEIMDGRNMGIGTLLRTVESGDLIVSFPLHWSYLERSVPGWPENVHGVSSTGPIRPDLILRLQQSGLDLFTEIYGSSEHGGMGFRHNPGLPFHLFSYLQSTGPSAESESAIVRTLPDGNLKKFPADDLLKWENEIDFHVLHRRDGAVQVAGINVYPEKVAAFLRKHPLVAECAVRLMCKTENPRLKAFIVPAQEMETDSLRREISLWIQQNLSAPERPVFLSFGRKIPKNEMGKAADWETD